MAENRVVFAAFGPELDALPSDHARHFVGVGLVEAALGTLAGIAALQPTEVVLVGTAGVYPGASWSVGDVVVAGRILLAAPSGDLVDAMPRVLRADAEGAVVATTLAITTDDEVARHLRDTTGADVENLEAFAVARACEHARVPFRAVLGISNEVGARGRAQWRANHASVAARACEVALRSPTRGRSLA